eukprot:TRINITY_DN3383_c0_g1_i2.p1 TRINITY_DN3383_c0_g1~~TRINITY_DN3383_c0_g1_i2.p1  ORF type:complete len:576 (-),score=151.23 TRINITY_DN3383_c0_g1_i2:265-1992(-)
MSEKCKEGESEEITLLSEFECLPYVVFDKILQELNFKERKNLATTSKWMRNLVMHSESRMQLWTIMRNPIPLVSANDMLGHYIRNEVWERDEAEKTIGFSSDKTLPHFVLEGKEISLEIGADGVGFGNEQLLKIAPRIVEFDIRITDLQKYKFLLPKLRNLRRLDLGKLKMGSVSLNILKRWKSTLKKLFLWSLDNQTLTEEFQFDVLESLETDFPDPTDLVHRAQDTLKCLMFELNNPLVDLTRMLQPLRSLTSLSITNNTKMGLPLPPIVPPTLQEFELVGFHFGNVKKHKSWGKVKLTSIRIVNFQGMDGVLYLMRTNSDTLKEIKLSGNGGTASVLSFQDFDTVLPVMSMLAFRNFGKVKGLTSLLEKCPRLKHLEMILMDIHKGDEVKRKKLPAHLDKLTICLGGNTPGTYFVSKQMLALFAALLPQITYLELANYELVDKIAHLVKPSLRHVVVRTGDCGHMDGNELIGLLRFLRRISDHIKILTLDVRSNHLSTLVESKLFMPNLAKVELGLRFDLRMAPPSKKHILNDVKNLFPEKSQFEPFEWSQEKLGARKTFHITLKLKGRFDV